MSTRSVLILLIGGATLGGFALLHSHRTLSVVPAPTSGSATVSEPASPATPVASSPSSRPAPRTTIAVTPFVTTSGMAVADDTPDMEAALTQIEDHFAAGDTGSLRRIAEQLRHPQPQVRLAAREALRAAGERELLPDIQFALEATTDAVEAAELQELADYLQLPSYTELQNSSPGSQASRVQRQRVTAPLIASRTTTSLPTDTTATTTPTSAADQLAQLQAENERLKLENNELRALVSPVAAQ